MDTLGLDSVGIAATRLSDVRDLCAQLRVLVCRDPYVTGTSVLGIKFKDGVMLAADTLGKTAERPLLVLCLWGYFTSH